MRFWKVCINLEQESRIRIFGNSRRNWVSHNWTYLLQPMSEEKQAQEPEKQKRFTKKDISEETKDKSINLWCWYKVHPTKSPLILARRLHGLHGYSFIVRFNDWSDGGWIYLMQGEKKMPHEIENSAIFLKLWSAKETSLCIHLLCV